MRAERVYSMWPRTQGSQALILPQPRAAVSPREGQLLAFLSPCSALAEAKCQASTAKKPGPPSLLPPSPKSRALPRVIGHGHWPWSLSERGHRVEVPWRERRREGRRPLRLSTRLQKQKCRWEEQLTFSARPQLHTRLRYLPRRRGKYQGGSKNSSLGKRL